MTRYYVTSYALKIRQGPSITTKVVGYLRKNEIVNLLGLSADKHWVNIQTSKGITGWSTSKYLAVFPEDASNDATGSSAWQYRVTAHALYVRLGPGLKDKIIGYLRKDEVVEAVEVSPDKKWRKIKRSNGLIGWCSIDYLFSLGSKVIPMGNEATLGKQREIAFEPQEVYEAPGQNDLVLGSLELEQVVDVLEVSQDNKWKKVITARGLQGWTLSGYLASLGEIAKLQPNEEFPWMPIAFGELDMREFPGSPNNPHIIEYLKSTDLENAADRPDETDWCSAFVNWCVERAGFQVPKSAMVYPWKRWGQAINTPRRGCITIFQWEGGGQHVAFYLGETGNYLQALGGNQSDAVWISSYHKSYVIGYRIPAN